MDRPRGPWDIDPNEDDSDRKYNLPGFIVSVVMLGLFLTLIYWILVGLYDLFELLVTIRNSSG